MSATIVGVDVGGTFTDLVALADGRIMTAKVPSTPADQALGVLAALRAPSTPRGRIDAIAHGTTVATNTLLERNGARTALVTTEGFADVVEIARQNRPSLYDLTLRRPPALVPRELRLTVRERMGPAGVVEPLDAGSCAAAIAALRAARVDSVAVCLLFGYLHPEHERIVATRIAEALPGVRVSTSSDVLPELREYERLSTTVADAYLAPRLERYLRSLASALERDGRPAPTVMQSSGGSTDVEGAVARAAACVLSGPAGGVVGAAFVAAASGFRDLLTFDMGGTSTDVAPIVAGEAEVTHESSVGGIPIRFPSLDVHSVSAGGGSIAWADDGGALRVGPRSAGARPGPACYGVGGELPTVTDANLLLGYLEDGAVLGGEVRLDRTRAETALEQLGAQLGLDALTAATGVLAVADAEMTRALRVISIERGLDPREFALAAYGGAGPLHACSLAEELGMTTVLVPRAAGVLSALGLAVAGQRRDYVAPFRGLLDFAALEAQAERELPGSSTVRLVDARYRGQSFELTVPAESWEAAFHALHERRFGFRIDDAPVELVHLRVVASRAVDAPSLAEPAGDGTGALRARRRAYLGGEWLDLPVLDREGLGAGSEVDGPAIVELAGSTCLVRERWSGRIDEAGSLVLRHA